MFKGGRRYCGAWKPDEGELPGGGWRGGSGLRGGRERSLMEQELIWGGVPLNRKPICLVGWKYLWCPDVSFHAKAISKIYISPFISYTYCRLVHKYKTNHVKSCFILKIFCTLYWPIWNIGVPKKFFSICNGLSLAYQSTIPIGTLTFRLFHSQLFLRIMEWTFWTIGSCQLKLNLEDLLGFLCPDTQIKGKLSCMLHHVINCGGR